MQSVYLYFFIFKNDKNELNPEFVRLVHQADELKAKHVEKYWKAGVIFKFCDLDKSKDQ